MVYRCSIGSCSMCVLCPCMPATSCTFCLEFKHVNSVMQAALPPQRRLLPRLPKMPATPPSPPLRMQHQTAVQVVFRMQHHVPSASIILVQQLSNFDLQIGYSICNDHTASILPAFKCNQSTWHSSWNLRGLCGHRSREQHRHCSIGCLCRQRRLCSQRLWKVTSTGHSQSTCPVLNVQTASACVQVSNPLCKHCIRCHLRKSSELCTLQSNTHEVHCCFDSQYLCLSSPAALAAAAPQQPRLRQQVQQSRSSNRLAAFLHILPNPHPLWA